MPYRPQEQDREAPDPASSDVEGKRQHDRLPSELEDDENLGEDDDTDHPRCRPELLTLSETIDNTTVTD